MRGAGIWLRKTRDVKPSVAAHHLDYVVLSLHSGERGPINRGPGVREWCAEYRAGGGVLHAMDWLPLAERPPLHLDETCDYARRLGCVGVMADLEPDAGWRQATSEARRYARAMEDAAGDLERSITDYGRGGMDARTMRAVLGDDVTSVPQSYDPSGTYAEGYHERSIAHWRSRGAERIVVGLGLWLRSERRHRDREEFARHLSTVPAAGVDGVCAWYAPAKRGPSPALAAVLPMLRAWSMDRFGPRDTVPAPPDFDRQRIEALAVEAKEAGDLEAADELASAYERVALRGRLHGSA